MDGAQFTDLIAHLNQRGFDPDNTYITKAGYIYLITRYSNACLFLTKKRDLYDRILVALRYPLPSSIPVI